jgi:hypothetical protein
MIENRNAGKISVLPYRIDTAVMDEAWGKRDSGKF